MSTGTSQQQPRPSCVLMIGMPGAGKTHLAHALTRHGFTRLCPDDEMLRRHGRRELDFPRSEYLLRERDVLIDLAGALTDLLAGGENVVFDHGLWTAAERANWRSLVVDAGGAPLTVYLPVPHEVRWARIQARNQRSTAEPSRFSEADLIRYARRFEPPADEPHLVYDGQVETILALTALPAPSFPPETRRGTAE